jgi:hypothetical protein
MRATWTPTADFGGALRRIVVESHAGRGGRLWVYLAGAPGRRGEPSPVDVPAAEVRRLTRFWLGAERDGHGELLVG